MGRITQYGSEADRAWVGAEYRVDLFPTVIFFTVADPLYFTWRSQRGVWGFRPLPIEKCQKILEDKIVENTQR